MHWPVSKIASWIVGSHDLVIERHLSVLRGIQDWTLQDCGQHSEITADRTLDCGERKDYSLCHFWYYKTLFLHKTRFKNVSGQAVTKKPKHIEKPNILITLIELKKP